jgi:IclR family pca regulon transcriptional regulator
MSPTAIGTLLLFDSQTFCTLAAGRSRIVINPICDSAGEPLVEEQPSNNFLRAFARGIRVICAFNEQHPRMTLSQVAERTGLTRANARRILLTLETLGYVTQHNRLFSLRPRVLEIGYAFLSSMDLPFYAQPVIDDLVERTHVPCNLAMLDGDEIIYVLRASTPHAPTPPIPLNVGRSFPAYVTSMGRILLGALPAGELDAYLGRADIQPFTPKTIVDRKKLKKLIEADSARGWSFVAGEQADWVASIGVPIHDAAGTTIAAVGMGWFAGTVPDQPMIDRLLPELQQAALSIEREIKRKR